MFMDGSGILNVTTFCLVCDALESIWDDTSTLELSFFSSVLES